MFRSVLILHIYIFVWVKTNPIPGFISYPINQYQEHYGNVEPPIFQTSSEFSPCPHIPLAQNQLMPYQNVPFVFNDYVQRIYLDDSQRSSLDSSFDQNVMKPQRYILNSANNLLVPNAYNYVLSPIDSIYENPTTRWNNVQNYTPATVINTSFPDYIDHSEHCEENPKNKTKPKRKNSCRTKERTHRKGHSNNKNGNVSKKRKCKNRSQKQNESEETDNFTRIGSKQKCARNKSLNNKESKRTEVETKPTNNDRRCKCSKTNNSRKKTKSYDSHSIDQPLAKLDDCFDINEDCMELQNRCTRNYNNDMCQQQYPFVPINFANNMANYIQSLISNNLLSPDFSTGNIILPYNFNNLYSLPQFNSKSCQGRPRKNKKNTKRKKEKKINRENCTDTTSNDFKMAPATTADESNKVSTKNCNLPAQSESQEITENISDLNFRNNSIGLGYEEVTPQLNVNVDDYYPEFSSDNIYISKEEYDWNNFNERNFYSSVDNSALGVEGETSSSNSDIRLTFKDSDGYIKLLDQLNLVTTNNEYIKKPHQYKPVDKLTFQIPHPQEVTSIETENIDEEDVVNITDNKTKQLNPKEEIQFMTPPALDFPDFKTEMIDTDNYNLTVNNLPNDKYEKPSNKMSAYSSTKSGKTHKIIDQNEVETVFGHSKVVKYGASSYKTETVDYNSDFEDSDEEDGEQHLLSEDGTTTIVLAKSSPHPYSTSNI